MDAVADQRQPEPPECRRHGAVGRLRQPRAAVVARCGVDAGRRGAPAAAARGAQGAARRPACASDVGIPFPFRHPGIGIDRFRRRRRRHAADDHGLDRGPRRIDRRSGRAGAPDPDHQRGVRSRLGQQPPHASDAVQDHVRPGALHASVGVCRARATGRGLGVCDRRRNSRARSDQCG
jgi:hypothetical protein